QRGRRGGAARLNHGLRGEERVPDRREARLDAQRLLVLDLELLELSDLPRQHGVFERVAETAERDDGVDDRRKDRAKAIALRKALADPGFRLPQGYSTQWGQRGGLQGLQYAIHDSEEGCPQAMSERPLSVRR